MSSSIAYYQELISESNALILKYERYIDGLRNMENENQRGVDEFSIVTRKRRGNIGNVLSEYYHHPLMVKLHKRLSGAIDRTYENSVLDSFEAIKEEIDRTIDKLKRQIEQEKDAIRNYQDMISQIEEEERIEEKRREEEAEAAKKKMMSKK